MSRNYIDKAKRGTRENDGQEYPIHDSRIPEANEDDIGKVPVVGANGNFEYADAPSGGSGGVYEVVPEDFDVEINQNNRSSSISSITIVGEDLIEAIEEGYDLVIDMQDEDLVRIFDGCYLYNCDSYTILLGKYRFKLDEATIYPFGNNGGEPRSSDRFKSLTKGIPIGSIPTLKSYLYQSVDLHGGVPAYAGILLVKFDDEEYWGIELETCDMSGRTHSWSSGGGGEEE